MSYARRHRHLTIHEPREKKAPEIECVGCGHYRFCKVPGQMRQKACHYAYDMGHSRGCDAPDCYNNRIHFDPDFKPIGWRRYRDGRPSTDKNKDT